jgi:PRTRC genetic system protein F
MLNLSNAGAPVATFCIPGMDPDIPFALGEAGQKEALDRICAELIVQLGRRGVPWRALSGHRLIDVLAEQLDSIAKDWAPNSFAAPELALTFDDRDLLIALIPARDLSKFSMKETIEGLEAAGKGLGWFVHKCIAMAGQGMAYRDNTQPIDWRWNELAEWSDEAFVRWLVASGEIETRPEDSAATLLEKASAQARLMPSDVVALWEGHTHLLDGPPSTSPPTASAASARRWVEQNPDSPYAACVRAALRLHRNSRGERGNLIRQSFARWGNDNVRKGMEDMTAIGALFMLTWSEETLPECFEIVQEFETHEMNSGVAEAQIAAIRIALNPEKAGGTARQEAVRAAKTILSLHKQLLCLDELMTFFKEEAHDYGT